MLIGQELDTNIMQDQYVNHCEKHISVYCRQQPFPFFFEKVSQIPDGFESVLQAFCLSIGIHTGCDIHMARCKAQNRMKKADVLISKRELYRLEQIWRG